MSLGRVHRDIDECGTLRRCFPVGTKKVNKGTQHREDTAAHIACTLYIAIFDEVYNVTQAAVWIVFCEIEAGSVDEPQEDSLAVPQDLDLALCKAGLGGRSDEASERIKLSGGGVRRDGGGVDEKTEERGFAGAARPDGDERVGRDERTGGGRRRGAGAKTRANVHGGRW